MESSVPTSAEAETLTQALKSWQEKHQSFLPSFSGVNMKGSEAEQRRGNTLRRNGKHGHLL